MRPERSRGEVEGRAREDGVTQEDADPPIRVFLCSCVLLEGFKLTNCVIISPALRTPRRAGHPHSCYSQASPTVCNPRISTVTIGADPPPSTKPSPRKSTREVSQSLALAQGCVLFTVTPRCA